MNLSYSKSSSYLSSLIQAQHKLGPYYDTHSNLIIQDKWSQFVYSNVMGGSLTPFSLVDIFRSVIGVDAKAVEKPEAKTKERTNHLVIHPFASQERKRWKPNKWVELVYKILKENPKLKISLVGSQIEAGASELIYNDPILESFRERINDLAGKTNIQQLHELLKTADLFIGHDSMVGHLASVAETKTLTISLGTVRPAETTPYGEGNYNLAPRTKCFPCFPTDKCDFYQCHADIPYQTAYSVTQQLLDAGEVDFEKLNKDNSGFHLNSVNVYRSHLSEIGRQQITQCIDHNPSMPEIFRNFYRLSWLFMLDGAEENMDYPELTTQTHAQLLRYVEGARQLFDLAEFGKKYSRYILEEITADTPNLTKIKEFSNKIDEIDKLCGIVKKSYGFLAPVVDYFAIAKSNIQGSNIVELTESSFYSYNDCASMCQIIYELIEKTIGEHKAKTPRDKQRTTPNI